MTKVAGASGVPTTMAHTALDRLKAPVDVGLGTADDAALTKVHDRAAGIKPPGES
ncbi:MAG: hypothetical protein AAGG57_07045 [Pseudomonadota bacterium]